MQKIDLKKPAVDFLKDIILFEKSNAIRGINVLIKYFEKNDLTSTTCKELLALEPKYFLKMRGISALGYVTLCDRLDELYALSKDRYTFFSAYTAMKELLEQRKYVPQHTIRKRLEKKRFV